MASIDASLKRLQTDYVDLYQIHRFDPETPIEETMEALHDIVKSGKVKQIAKLVCANCSRECSGSLHWRQLDVCLAVPEDELSR